MSYQTLLTSLENNIYTITINRPDKLNALNKTVIEELSAAIDEVYNNIEIRSAIITGAGEEAFVAGADISEFLQLDQSPGEALARKGHQMVFDKIENSPKPIVAAVNGFALGGGCELALACHFIFASSNAKFGQPEVNLGLIPGYGGTQRLVRYIGKGKATELLLTADMINATDALQLGLVNYVTTPEELIPKCKSILDKIKTKSPLVVDQVIACVNSYYSKTEDGFELEIDEFANCFGTKDFKEGTTAFLEKRKATFIGK